jgi:hypothetical protein
MEGRELTFLEWQLQYYDALDCLYLLKIRKLSFHIGEGDPF